MIEMFNAFNAISDEQSLLTVGIFANPFLLVAVLFSVFFHSIILYFPIFESKIIYI